MLDGLTAAANSVSRLEHTISQVAAEIAATGDPVFLRAMSPAPGPGCRWGSGTSSTPPEQPGPGWTTTCISPSVTRPGASRGFRLTHRQAVSAQAVALAADTPPRVVTFGEVAPVAMMLGSAELLRAWVLATLAGLATDDEHHARLRHTLLAFLQSGGSYKAAAEQMMLHNRTVQYRIGKAEESLGRPPARTATTSNSRCASATGSARPCCSPALHRPPPDGNHD